MFLVKEKTKQVDENKEWKLFREGERNEDTNMEQRKFTTSKLDRGGGISHKPIQTRYIRSVRIQSYE